MCNKLRTKKHWFTYHIISGKRTNEQTKHNQINDIGNQNTEQLVDCTSDSFLRDTKSPFKNICYHHHQYALSNLYAWCSYQSLAYSWTIACVVEI